MYWVVKDMKMKNVEKNIGPDNVLLNNNNDSLIGRQKSIFQPRFIEKL